MTTVAEKVSTNDPLQLLTPGEVAKRFQFATRTVRFLAMVGELPGFKIGRSWRFRAADLERYLAYHRNGKAQ